MRPAAFEVTSLGEARLPTPVSRGPFVDDTDGVLLDADPAHVVALVAGGEPLPAFALAGPRRRLYFDPSRITCGVVTCGGLCPGSNDVIRSVVLTLKYAYGVTKVLGFRYGYSGLVPGAEHPPVALTQDVVDQAHKQGGTLLGSSRGAPTVEQMIDGLAARGVDLLFAIGGDGTLRGVSALCEEIARRGLAIAVVGIPKTIDNDLMWVERSFGFSTAVEEACRAITAAHAEARGAPNGVGLVKLMGRHSGFIAAHATLANSDVNFCLVPEVPFRLDGPGGFLDSLEQRLAQRHHAVVVVAEGAAQDELRAAAQVERDASGNVKLIDVGPYLLERTKQHFADRNIPLTIKYIDPSYMVRSLAANARDSEYCLLLGQQAVHAGMAGKTDVMIGFWNQRFTLVPVARAVAERKRLDPEGPVWQAVLGATGQPPMS